MLKNYLQAVPPTKFVLIEDNLQEKGKPLAEYIAQIHTKTGKGLTFFNFENNSNVVKSNLITEHDTVHSFLPNFRQSTTDSLAELEKCLRSKLNIGNIILLDSLVHMIYLYSLTTTYRVLSNLMQEMKGGSQIIAILHTDLLENSEKVCQCMEHLSTLSLRLEPDSSRISYTYKKAGGRIQKQLEEYKFENGEFKTESIKKPDLQKLIQTKIEEISPENLTTFKIGLSESEKKLRTELVLPYLPKDQNTEEGGQIFYKFDEVDDWDEEDPDDDLDL